MIGIFLCSTLHAQTNKEESAGTVPDSSFIFYFPACIQMFKADYKNNRQTLREFRQHLRTFAKGKDTLYVNGYSGECDPAGKRNRLTAYHRCNNLKGYLINFYGLRERDFRTVNIPHNHPELGDIVLISRKKEVLSELSEPPQTGKEAERKPTGRGQDDVSVRQPEQLEQQPETVTQPQTQSEMQPEMQPQTQPQQAQPEPPVAVSSATTSDRYVAVKTNLAAWAGTIINLAADVQVACHWSVELPVLWCPWHVTDKHAVKTFVVQPEARYWLRTPGAGHFFGLHAHMGWFNVKWDRDRYQDTSRPLLGAGISYGYLLPLSAHWAGEFTLGAGYANLKYDTYYNIDNGARIDTRTKNYWGITRVGLSVVYRFNLKK